MLAVMRHDDQGRLMPGAITLNLFCGHFGSGLLRLNDKAVLLGRINPCICLLYTSRCV